MRGNPEIVCPDKSNLCQITYFNGFGGIVLRCSIILTEVVFGALRLPNCRSVN
jgi:hypothetical protein